MNGVLVIHKAAGMTSHDVVMAARRILKEKRIGHTGTLDPMATGVLVLCIGKATRIARYLEAGEKEYRAVARLGVTTNTLDAEGDIVERRAYDTPAPRVVVDALKSFTGTILQRPPAFSAVKISGVPSYKLAREGKAEPNKLRTVTVYSIVLNEYNDPLIDMTIRCSKGVYIRTLCADLGEMLATGAHLASLVRSRSGAFSLDQAITLDDLAKIAATGSVDKVLISMDRALAEFPEITLDDPLSAKILQGNKISWERADLPEKVRVHDTSGNLIALAGITNRELRPELVFHDLGRQ